MYLHRGLIVLGSGKYLALPGWYGGISRNNLRGQTTHGLHTQRKGCHVQQKNVFYLPSQNTALDSCTDSYAFIGVDLLLRVLLEELSYEVLDSGHPGHSTNKKDFVYVRWSKSSILECPLSGPNRLFNQILRHGLKAFPGQLLFQMFGTGLIHPDVRQRDDSAEFRGELNLGLLRSVLQSLHCNTILGEVYTVSLLKSVYQPVHDPPVEIIPS